MATSQKLKEDFLTCNICMEVYQNPCTLKCEHTLCRECLFKYIPTKPDAIRDKSIPCPFCRYKTPVPHPDRPVEEWAGQFKAGLVIQGLMDSLCQHTSESVLTCSLCNEGGETNPASAWCSDCRISLCDGCLKVHRKIPMTRHHDVACITEEDVKRKRSFMCKEHKTDEIELFCKSCLKFLCKVCRSINHKECQNVVTIQEMAPEVKQEIDIERGLLEKKTEMMTNRITTRNDSLDKFCEKADSTKSYIVKTFKEIVDQLLQKQKNMTDMVDAISEERRQKLNAETKADTMTIQGYQQESEFLIQALQAHCVSDMYTMYQSYKEWARETYIKTDAECTPDVVQIIFTHDKDKLREAFEMMTVTTLDKDSVGLASAALMNVLDAKMADDTHPASLRDIVDLTVGEINFTVVTDCENNCLKSFFEKDSKLWGSKISFQKYPWNLTKVHHSKVAVSVPLANEIDIVNIYPTLLVESCIPTIKVYYGLASLSPGILVAGSVYPPSVDTIDMCGTVLRTFQHLTSPTNPLQNPGYLHVTEKGHILVSDWKLKSVFCLTANGDVVFTYTNKELKSVCGLTTAKSGDILIVDSGNNNLIQITDSGKFVGDILTSKDGLTYPYGLCLRNNTLYVAMGNGKVKIQRLL